MELVGRLSESGEAPRQGGGTVRPVVQHTRRDPGDLSEDLLRLAVQPDRIDLEHLARGWDLMAHASVEPVSIDQRAARQPCRQGVREQLIQVGVDDARDGDPLVLDVPDEPAPARDPPGQVRLEYDRPRVVQPETPVVVNVFSLKAWLFFRLVGVFPS